jgi:hypothetical protein
MSDRDDLKATEDDLVADAARLKAIETEKQGLELADPRLAELSAEAETIARQMVPKTVAERELVAEGAGG